VPQKVLIRFDRPLTLLYNKRLARASPYDSEYNFIEMKRDTFSFAVTRIADLLNATAGITLYAGNNPLIVSSVKQRRKALRISTAKNYLIYLESTKAGSEIKILTEMLASNLTMFFRDGEQLNFLVSECLPKLLKDNLQLNVWSAACSSGEEPYTLGMIFSEFPNPLGELDWRIHASDLSESIIAEARRATYSEGQVAKVPKTMREKYFDVLTSGDGFAVSSRIRERTEFSCSNLFDEHEFDSPFQIIVCRNILIYCDWHVQQSLIRHLEKFLAPSGYLFLGDLESLNGISLSFRSVGPRVYQKTGVALRPLRDSVRVAEDLPPTSAGRP
jgi:chemotaxis protein methyltransferase CheR